MTKKNLVSGSGNVATNAIEKIHELGGKVIACSESDGFVHDQYGIDLNLVKQIERGRIHEYADQKTTPNFMTINQFGASSVMLHCLVYRKMNYRKNMLKIWLIMAAKL